MLKAMEPYMYNLIAVSILWAFSFSFIGVYLAGQVDTYLAVLIRFVLALIVLLPFIKIKNLPVNIVIKTMFVGAVQIGLMYLAFYNSFLFLSVPEVILFTIFTPLHITLINDIIDRNFQMRFFIAALVAVIGAGIIKWNSISDSFLLGFLLVQLANLFFAFGQVYYVRFVKLPTQVKDINVFAYFYLGAIAVVLPTVLIKTNFSMIHIGFAQGIVLLWLGIVASGVGYFLWNKGAREVSSGRLAVMNNLVIPLGLIVNLVIWKTPVDFVKLIAGLFLIIVAILISKSKKKAT